MELRCCKIVSLTSWSTAGVVHPGLESSAQQGHEPVGAGPEEATKMIGGWSTSAVGMG